MEKKNEWIYYFYIIYAGWFHNTDANKSYVISQAYMFVGVEVMKRFISVRMECPLLLLRRG